MRSIALVAAVVMVVAATGAHQGQSRTVIHAAGPKTPTVFVSPSGNDASRCTASSPCRSLDRAYHLAAPGAVVQVAGGVYDLQAINDDPAKDKPGTASVVFRPAPGATAQFGGVTIAARHIEFAGTGRNNGFSFVTWTAASGANDVTFRDVSTQLFGILSASHISIIGGQVGPWDSSPAGEDSQIKAQSGDASPPTDILISGVYFHDITKNAYPDYHTDCLQFGSGQHVVIRGNTFARCSDTDLFVRSWARGPADDLEDFVIEHNVFGPTTVDPGYFDLQLADSQVDGDYCNSFVFRYNVVIGRGIVFNCSPPAGSAGSGMLYGNILPRVDIWTCGQNTDTGKQPAYSHNFYSETSSAVCDRTESVTRPLIIVNPVRTPKGRNLRLEYTLVAPVGTPVKLVVYQRSKALSTVNLTAPTTPGVRRVSLRLPTRSGATRYCVTAGSAPDTSVGCALFVKQKR